MKTGHIVEGFTEMRSAVGRPWPRALNRELAAVHCELGHVLLEYSYVAHPPQDWTVPHSRLLNAWIEFRRAAMLDPASECPKAPLVAVARQACAHYPCFRNSLALGGAYFLSSDFERAKQAYEECKQYAANSPKLLEGLKRWPPEVDLPE